MWKSQCGRKAIPKSCVFVLMEFKLHLHTFSLGYVVLADANIES